MTFEAKPPWRERVRTCPELVEGERGKREQGERLISNPIGR